MNSSYLTESQREELFNQTLAQALFDLQKTDLLKDGDFSSQKIEIEGVARNK